MITNEEAFENLMFYSNWFIEASNVSLHAASLNIKYNQEGNIKKAEQAAEQQKRAHRLMKRFAYMCGKWTDIYIQTLNNDRG